MYAVVIFPQLSLRGARILGDEAISGIQGVLRAQKERLPRGYKTAPRNDIKGESEGSQLQD